MQSLRVFRTLCILSRFAIFSVIWQNIPVQAQNLNNNQASELLKQADFFIESNQFLAAQTKLEEALRVYQAAGINPGQQETLIDLGIVYYRQGRNQRALEYLQQAETIPGNSSQRGRLLSSQGLVYLELGDYYRALTNFQQAQGTQLQDLPRENRNQIGLGESYRYIGAYAQALQILELALRVPGERSDRAQALNAVGNVYFDLGQYEQSLDYYQQALALRQSIGDRSGVAKALTGLGETFLKSVNLFQAIESLQAGVDIFESLRPGLRDEQKVAIFETQTYAYGPLSSTTKTVSKPSAQWSHI